MLSCIEYVKYISRSSMTSFESDTIVDEHIDQIIKQKTSVIQKEIACDNVGV